jgi:hypothetical protein
MNNATFRHTLSSSRDPSKLIDQKRIPVDASEVSAFEFLEEIKSTIQWIFGIGDFLHSWDLKHQTTHTPHWVVHLRKSIGRYIIHSHSITDPVTKEILTASKIPQTLFLRKASAHTRYDPYWNKIAHEQIPYTPIKIEINPQYRWSLVITLEKEIGTRRKIQLILPLRETYALSFNKIELKELQTRRKNGTWRVTLNGSQIDELDLLQYGRDILEIGTGEYYLYIGDAIQTLEMHDGKIEITTQEITALSDTIKIIPTQKVSYNQ